MNSLEGVVMANPVVRAHVMRQCPTKMCHASTLLRLKDGSVLVAWFGGSVEGNDDVGIYLAKGMSGGFGPPRLIAQSDEPHWNPVLFQPDADTVALYYKVGRKISRWRTLVRLSKDGGETFTEESELVPGDEGGRGPVRAKPIRLSSGAIAAPSSTEDGPWRAFIDRSEDGGRHWKRSNLIGIDRLSGDALGNGANSGIPVSEQSFGGRGVIQPTLWESAPGSVHALMRSSEGRVYRADSRDGGRSFSAAYATQIPNNNSGIDVARLEDGRLALLHNPVGINWGPRTPMRLSISSDSGASFQPLMDLDSGEGEFAYPAIVADGMCVYLSYTYKRENIAYWEIHIDGEKWHEK
jgi:predicted neuraminidase